jgi:Phytanoyl-CoA dioxygenase (PhyH)
VEPEQVRAAFVDRGVVRLDGAFSSAAAERIRAVVWRYAEAKIGVRPDDRNSWPSDGWLPISWKSLKRNPAFNVVVDNPSVTTALDAIFGAGRWRRPKRGAQVLFSTPTPGPWRLPDGWHMDCGFEQPTWPVFAVKLFAFVGDVGPCGGGTLVLPGSHHLVSQYRNRYDNPPAGGKQNWQPFLRQHPPLGALLNAADHPDRGRSVVGERYEVAGVPVDVHELVGAAGDIVITHLHVIHTTSLNTNETPRQMLATTLTST